MMPLPFNFIRQTFSNKIRLTSNVRNLSQEPEKIPFLARKIDIESRDLEHGADAEALFAEREHDADLTSMPGVLKNGSACTSNAFLSIKGCGLVRSNRFWKRWTAWFCCSLVVLCLCWFMMLWTAFKIGALGSGVLVCFFPDAWLPSQSQPADLGRWATDFSADIHPVACHSHNDYWRRMPLFSALHAGCTGVEADVWLFDEELYVGHSTASLTSKRTLRTLYFNPLMEILDRQNPLTSFHPSVDTPRNGVFDTDPAQTLVLLIDFKDHGQDIWPHVVEQLQPLRDKGYLTYFNGSDVIDGPVTVVVTGNAPFQMVVKSPHYRDMFFDAPLALMEKLSDMTPPSQPSSSESSPAVTALTKRTDQNQGQGLSGSAPLNPAIYSRANSYYASVNFKDTIGWPWQGSFSSLQMDKIRKQIAGAHSRGLKVRYWGVPNWPKSMRNYIWRTLVEEGVDYLNVDDLKAATQGSWGWNEKTWFDWFWRSWFSKSASMQDTSHTAQTVPPIHGTAR